MNRGAIFACPSGTIMILWPKPKPAITCAPLSCNRRETTLLFQLDRPVDWQMPVIHFQRANGECCHIDAPAGRDIDIADGRHAAAGVPASRLVPLSFLHFK